ncbi:putative alpha/beta hydrolase family protein DUF2235 [Shimia isoporae]|uniref:Putative alpha/beta hydrolase family protein DUF2235 n=1 Tax=Shimia isoporae TaxID=647720 RepID=A0A4R1N7X0_9RHOB|nr:DUF2235 domain-containing protein [Shimia isoporae]TCK99388.1 putative alpha/beta hydrolase family protein DUF2235 [Shimia isoporae]
MPLRTLHKSLWNWLRGGPKEDHSKVSARRGPVTHVIILDGTLSSLRQGEETNAGLTYRLLQEAGPQVSLYYEAGVQWPGWRQTLDVLMGRGINRQIRRAYGYLASRFRVGDRIILMGYSRGAFAVRSLAGVIDRVGLLRADCATERNIRTAYRHYELTPESEAAKTFAKAHCHEDVSIEMVGVWDTVKALGARLPLLWRVTEKRHAFHNHHLSPVVKHGFQALALDETRSVFMPEMWECPDMWDGRVEQVWFRGAHGDVGGQLHGFEPARPLGNIPLVWMLGHLEDCGVELPTAWKTRFECDATGPMLGTWRRWGKFFWLRKRRIAGRDRSESVHATAKSFVKAGVVKARVVGGLG